MRLISPSRYAKLDWGVMISSFILVIIGLATLYSLEMNQDPPDFSRFERQLVVGVIGFVFFVMLMFFDYRHLKDIAYILYGIGIIVLASVLVFGVTIRGTTGWFSLAGFTFQPVEFFKPIFIIALAKFMSDVRTLNAPRMIISASLFVLTPIVLIYLQPDLGSLSIVVVIWAGMLLMRGLRPLYVFIGLIGGVLLAVFAWFFLLVPYQHERILTFINPSQDPSGAGYNVTQSRIAIGSGRIFGRGLGLGTQSSLNFLPEQETDFIFAVIAESLGILGAVLLICLYVFLLWRIVRLIGRFKDSFACLIAAGIFFWFAFQGFANIAMNLGLVPVFGVPLPFLSYGGSSLIMNIITIGMLESACLYGREEHSY